MSVLDEVKTPNPWARLRPGDSPYVHAPDLPAIERHNLHVADKYRIRLNVFPEPYLGHPDAPILLLNLNPGYKDYIRAVHAKPAVAESCMDSLLHRPSPCPFYPLGRTYLDNGGSEWWSKHLSHWISEYGPEAVARCFFCVEYFPYASVKYKPFRLIIPSQRYSFDLVATKIRSCCPVIVMRARSAWAEALPGIDSEKWYRLNSLQSAHISPGNMPEDAVQAVHAATRSVRVS